MVAVAALVAAAWLAPATLLDARIANATDSVVRLVDAEGTIWNGRATLTANAARIPVTWQVDGWPLLRGVVQARMRSVAGTRVTGVFGAPPLDLGEVRATLTASDDTISGTADNAGGDLALRGDWSFRVEDGLVLALLLTPRRADQTELKQALAAIGTVDGDGWRVDWRVPLR